MGNRDPRIDAYIAKQQEFAKPILRYVRDVIHEGCPQCEEDLKWNSPAFIYNGAILAGVAGFKQHVQFGFWKHELVLGGRPREGMGFGKISSIEDLPPKKELLSLVKKAMALQDAGVKVTRMARKPKKAIPVPGDLKAALAKKKKAKSAFDDFSPSHKHEYLEWITEAKAEETRKRRLEQAIEWMAEGKPRNWKYM